VVFIPSYRQQDYRKELVPNLTANWSELSTTEQDATLRMNNFFCGLHYIVGLAEQAQACLSTWEKTAVTSNNSHSFPNDSEPGTVRLIRTTCKALEAHCSEQAGNHVQFKAYLEMAGYGSIPLARFVGNRFNILFYNAAGVYYLREQIVAFYDKAFGTPNRLHSAVRDDLRRPEYLAACRALGIIDKLITGPLWRRLASPTTTIASVSAVYSSLLESLNEWKDDASPLLEGYGKPFQDAHISLDEVHQELFEQDDCDADTLVVLQLLSSAFAVFTERLLKDHLPGGEYHTMTEKMQSQTASVSTTNVASERTFAQLDRQKREKPNASVVAIEGMMLFANNETTEWLSKQTPERRSQLFTSAIQGAEAHRHLYRQRCQKIRDHHQAVVKEKLQKREKKAAEDLRMKEQLSRDIAQVGLWSTEDEVLAKLATVPLVSKKVSTLKTQVKFRKVVLQQQADKSLFQYSANGKAFTWQELAKNLISLITAASEEQAPSP